jgi:diguanylate cyclase (GGDEF)-like protein/PAS domain S-box-containing protein
VAPDRLRACFELAPVGIGVVDLEGRTALTNGLLRDLLGYSEHEFATLHFSEYTHPDDIEQNERLYAEMVSGSLDQYVLEKRFISKTGSVVWAHLTVSLVRDDHGEPAFIIGMTEDITLRKQLEAQLQVAEQKHELLVERVPAVVYVADAAAPHAWTYVSPQITNMLGYAVDEWLDDANRWLSAMDPRDRAFVLAERARAGQATRRPAARSLTYRLRHRAGATVWVRDDAVLLSDESGRSAYHGVLVDVSREKQLEERLEHQALHDPLTNLPNRELFRDRVARAIAGSASRRDGEPGESAVLFIDLDGFKTINDTFGHACGDGVIVEAARRLRGCVRELDTAARLGGDEFAVLLEGATLAAAIRVAEAFIDALTGAPVELPGRSVAISASIGIATTAGAETAETALRNADLAMYQAKRNGRARWATYDPGMHASVANRFRLEAALQAALNADEITLAFQPIVELSTGTVAGLEALARWNDPILGPVPPGDFIAVAEETGVIHELGQRLLDRACRELGAWRRATGADAYVSVNVSPLQLNDERFPDTVGRILAATGTQPHNLVLEVTEGLLLMARSHGCLRRLRQMGIRIAIDDFGTGYSSLSYLRQLPVDMVKIDQSFTRRVDDGPDAAAFMAAIIQLSRTVGLITICEGIETDSQLRTVAEASCGLGQGYLLGRPGPIIASPARLAVRPEPADEHLSASRRPSAVTA